VPTYNSQCFKMVCKNYDQKYCKKTEVIKNKCHTFICTFRSVGGIDTLLYRRAQILNGLFNESHVGTLFAALAGCSIMQTSILYTLFRSFRNSTDVSVPLPVLLWNMIMIGILVLIMLYVFGKAGSLHTKFKANTKKAVSNSVYATKGKKGGLMRRQRMFCRSCAPLKVAIGSSNFVESVTPLKFQDFSMNRFVDFLLLGKKE